MSNVDWFQAKANCTLRVPTRCITLSDKPNTADFLIDIEFDAFTYIVWKSIYDMVEDVNRAA